MLTSFQYFAPVSWYVFHNNKPELLIDTLAVFKRASTHNRMQLASASGIQILSIPLKGGRNQRKPLQEIEIDYNENWQRNHYRTLVSIYNRSPFFEYYEPLFKQFYTQVFPNLFALNEAAHHIVAHILSSTPPILLTESVSIIVEGQNFQSYKPYNQVFLDKVGFIPNCSILDLLFCTGNKGLENII